jgi:hypothetical protein
MAEPPAAGGGAAAALGDALHALFVLLTTASYLLPLYEAASRRSAFYGALFSAVFAASFTLHCEETGLCSPLAPATHAALKPVSDALSYFLLSVMLLVVLEIRNERLGRGVGGAWAVLVWATDPGATARNTGVTLLLALAVLILDVAAHKRKFTPAYWRRLGLIAAMAAVGAALFRLLRVLWVWHGVWHLYAAAATWLLLLAQRHKQRMLASKGAGGGSGGSGSGAGRGGHSSGVGASLTTPLKRAGRGGGGGGVDGAAAGVLPGSTPGGGGGGLGGGGGEGGGAGGGGGAGLPYGGGEEGPIPV